MDRIKNIEFLRFLFSIIIVIFHLGYCPITVRFTEYVPLYDYIVTNIKMSIAVDFFFIISGFFLFYKDTKEQSYVEFALKKFIRLMPVVIFTIAISFIASIFISKYKFFYYENLFTILNIQSVLLQKHVGNLPTAWFISSLFWGMSFYFYLKKCVNGKVFNIISAIIVILCYYSISVNKNLFITTDMVRALAGIGIGYFIVAWYKENFSELEKTKNSIVGKLLYTVAEFSLFSFLIYSMLHKNHYGSRIFYIILFIFLFILFLLKKGYFSKMLENNLSIFLGQFAFSIYVIHYVLRDIWRYSVTDVHWQWVISHPYVNIISIFVICVAGGILSFYLVEKPVAKYLKNRLFR